MWVSRSWIVIGRRAATTVRPLSALDATVVCANAGMNRLTGSLNAILPSSTRMRIAVLVIAFDCDAMRKIASGVIGRRDSRSIHPTLFV